MPRPLLPTVSMYDLLKIMHMLFTLAYLLPNVSYSDRYMGGVGDWRIMYIDSIRWIDWMKQLRELSNMI